MIFSPKSVQYNTVQNNEIVDNTAAVGVVIVPDLIFCVVFGNNINTTLLDRAIGSWQYHTSIRQYHTP